MAVYGKGNTLGKPIGSGWWVAELDAGECNVQAAGIYGCHFDAGGTNKICGAAVVQAAQDEVVIEPLPATPPDATPGSAGSAPAPLPVQSATTQRRRGRSEVTPGRGPMGGQPLRSPAVGRYFGGLDSLLPVSLFKGCCSRPSSGLLPAIIMLRSDWRTLRRPTGWVGGARLDGAGAGFLLVVPS